MCNYVIHNNHDKLICNYNQIIISIGYLLKIKNIDIDYVKTIYININKHDNDRYYLTIDILFDNELIVKEKIGLTTLLKLYIIRNKIQYFVNDSTHNVHHIDINKHNNLVENLQLIERNNHHYKHGYGIKLSKIKKNTTNKQHYKTVIKYKNITKINIIIDNIVDCDIDKQTIIESLEKFIIKKNIHESILKNRKITLNIKRYKHHDTIDIFIRKVYCKLNIKLNKFLVKNCNKI